MKSFATRIAIHAPAEKVWRVLTDLPNWRQWNTTVERTEGIVGPGAKVTVYVKQSPNRAFPLRVSELDSPRRMVWVGGMPLGLFRGTRVYGIAAAPGGGVEFSMHEDYTGPLAGLIGKSIPDLQPAFEEFAQCLKRECERT
ncbi:MAG: SRPBCC domain-containing protein [Steroidobacteraceae bacterium]